jgi:murein L,D-transpeptidase YafK
MMKNLMVLVSLLCSAVAMGCSSAPAVVGAVKADRIIIVKSKHSMVLMANGKPLRSYRVALGKADGAKERQGDHKTPVGQYVIDQKNAQSRFHLALHVSYPNAADYDPRRREAVRLAGASPT